MSLKLLSQCLASTGVPTHVAVAHSSTSEISLCVTGSRTEIVSVYNGKANAVRVKSADRATALCCFDDGYLVAVPDGTVQFVQVRNEGMSASASESAMAKHATCFTHLTSSCTGGIFAASRSELSYVDSASSSVRPLGTVAGTAGLPISSIAAVPESPSLILVAVHNRLIQIDIRESIRQNESSSILPSKRAWNLHSNTSKVTTVSASGTALAASTNDGKVCVWDVRNTNQPEVIDVTGDSRATMTCPSAVTSCVLLGEGTLFTTDMRGFIKVWLRPNPVLPFECVVLSPICGKLDAGRPSPNLQTFATPAIRCGSLGSRVGGSVFAAVDDLGVVSVFGQDLIH